MGCLGSGSRGQAYKTQVGNHSIFPGYVQQPFMLSIVFCRVFQWCVAWGDFLGTYRGSVGP